MKQVRDWAYDAFAGAHVRVDFVTFILVAAKFVCGEVAVFVKRLRLFKGEFWLDYAVSPSDTLEQSI